jgi:acetyltransferase-like isoleucine patch superfamily enzyme
VAGLKTRLKSVFMMLLGKTTSFCESFRRASAFASLGSSISGKLDPSVVVLGRPDVHGTGNVQFGHDVYLYREVHLETWGPGKISVGNHVLLNRGVHIVSMSEITIGDETMIGEYTSIRDANHSRISGEHLRNSGHKSKPIEIGREVWIGRGVMILPGVRIGDYATIGANAVVTKDIPAGATVGGVPAVQIRPASEKT